MIDQADKEAMAKCHALNKKIEEIQSEIDDILDPICKRLLEERDFKKIREMMYLMPSGIQRSELGEFLQYADIHYPHS